MRAYIEVKGHIGFADGEWAIGITNIATRQTTVPPLAFPTMQAAQAVVDAICCNAPALYTNVYPWSEEGSSAAIRWGQVQDLIASEYGEDVNAEIMHRLGIEH